MPVSVQLLSQIPLLRSLQPEVLARLSSTMGLKEFARRAMVLVKETPAPTMGFLLEGRLQGVDFTVDGRSVGLFFVEPGDYFGELSVVDGRQPAEYVVAATRSTVAFLEAAQARDLVFSQPDIARAVMLRLATRVRAVMAQRTLLSLPNPFQRLCTLLLQLPHKTSEQGIEIEQAPTHQEMAIMINASRETVTRAFQLLFAREVLTRNGNTLHLTHPAFFKDVAEGRLDPPKS